MPTEDPNASGGPQEVPATREGPMPAAVADVLAAARVRLRDYQEDLRKIVFDLGPYDAYSIGRLIEAADIAEDAVFNVLNVANSHFDAPLAAAAIERSRHGRSAAGA